MNNFLDTTSIFDVHDCREGFYGEWVPVYTEQDKVDALEYLRLWKKFLLLKLDYMKQTGEEIIVDHTIPSVPFIKPTIVMKLQLEKKG